MPYSTRLDACHIASQHKQNHLTMIAEHLGRLPENQSLKVPAGVFLETHSDEDGLLHVRVPKSTLMKVWGNDAEMPSDACSLPLARVGFSTFSPLPTSSLTYVQLLELFLSPLWDMFTDMEGLRGLFLMVCGPAITVPTAYQSALRIVERQASLSLILTLYSQILTVVTSPL